MIIYTIKRDLLIIGKDFDMKLAIMQPYFLPYLGYFSLIKHTEQFILLDNVQFIRHGWIERNRVLKQNESWLYIQVPLLKTNRETKIRDILIDNNQNWKQKIISQIQPYKKISQNYFKVVGLFNDLFANEYNSIVNLNKDALTMVCNYLNIENDINIFSNMNLTIKKPDEPDEWALNICQTMGNVSEYWNPIGGLNFFNMNKYKHAGLNLKFQKMNLLPYSQKRSMFESGLSIIDVMMFNSVEEINQMLDNYELI